MLRRLVAGLHSAAIGNLYTMTRTVPAVRAADDAGSDGGPRAALPFDSSVSTFDVFPCRCGKALAASLVKRGVF